MKRIDLRWFTTAVICLALVVFFTGCPTEAPQPDPGRLTITGGFEGNSLAHAVYVFPPAANLSTPQHIQNAMIGPNLVALGAIATGAGNVFTLATMAGGFWTGSGSFQVVLVNSNGGIDNAENPMFRRAAAVSFSNGNASVGIGGFAPVVGGGGEGGMTTVFDLANDVVFQALPLNIPITDEMFEGTPFRYAGASFMAVQESGRRALHFSTGDIYWRGLRIDHSFVNFAAGDTIRIAGRVVTGTVRVHLCYNINSFGAPLGGWNPILVEGNAFEREFTLSAEDVSAIIANAHFGNPSHLQLRTRESGSEMIITELIIRGERPQGWTPDNGNGNGGPGNGDDDGTIPAELVGDWGIPGVEGIVPDMVTLTINTDGTGAFAGIPVSWSEAGGRLTVNTAGITGSAVWEIVGGRLRFSDGQGDHGAALEVLPDLYRLGDNGGPGNGGDDGTIPAELVGDWGIPGVEGIVPDMVMLTINADGTGAFAGIPASWSEAGGRLTVNTAGITGSAVWEIVGGRLRFSDGQGDHGTALEVLPDLYRLGDNGGPGNGGDDDGNGPGNGDQLPPPADPSRLVINNFEGGTLAHIVYVFTPGTNLSTPEAITNVILDGWVSSGTLTLGYANKFLMTRGWEGSLLMPGEWTGSGTLQVILLYNGGVFDDVTNPMFRLAAVVFANGSATVDIGSFAPIVTNFTVTFDSNGGSAVPTQRVNIGDTANRPEDPSWEHRNFVDWYADSDLTTVHDFSTPVTQNITLFARWEYTGGTISVTNNADRGPGSLRYAIDTVPPGYTIYIEDGVGTIRLESPLEINRSLTIKGNGTTLTRSAGWTAVEDMTQLLRITSSVVTVGISRMHFTGGRANNNGAAINHNGGTLILESSVFSNNVTGGGGSGGAIWSGNNGTLIANGNTFFGNSAGGLGGAIQSSGANSTVTLTGNLFHGNTSALRPVASGSNIVSGGFNVVDLPFGTGDNQSGWLVGTGDSFVADIPVSPVSFRLLSGSGAAGVIPSRTAEYPTVDFFGNGIIFPAAAGAVQSPAVGYLLTIIDNARGDVNVSPEPNVDGLHIDVTLTPVPSTATANEYTFSHWLVNGIEYGSDVPLNLRLTGNTNARAVFTTTLVVTDPGDATGAALRSGTLRYALQSSVVGDRIRFSGPITVELIAPLNVTSDIVIEGNGATITRSASFTQMLHLLVIYPEATVSISRIHFRGGMSSGSGGAIRNNGGTLILESCIFSHNVAALGGALENSNGGTLIVRGNTFFQNRATSAGGTINNSDGTLTMTGNLFYRNTAASGNMQPVVRNAAAATVKSLGFNIVDVMLGGGVFHQSGWIGGTGDTTLEGLGIPGIPFDEATFVPVDGLRNVMPGTPIEDFPAFDFNGNPRTWPGAPGAVNAP